MSILSGYKKPGGFAELLMLVESSEPEKQAALIKAIEDEGPAWGQLIKTKLLTPEKIFSWEGYVVDLIVNSISEETLAYALEGVSPGAAGHAKAILSDSKLVALEKFLLANPPTPEDIQAAAIRLVAKVRDMEDGGEISLTDVDPASALDDERSIA